MAPSRVQLDRQICEELVLLAVPLNEVFKLVLTACALDTFPSKCSLTRRLVCLLQRHVSRASACKWLHRRDGARNLDRCKSSQYLFKIADWYSI
jgi:hypothetical protein